MKMYIGTKIIKATPMTREDAEKHLGRNVGGNKTGDGYLVEYEGGYQAWSPKDVFESAYRMTNGMNFGLALEALKMGKRIARSGWNGKGMYLWLLPASLVKAEWCREPHLKNVADANGGQIECLGSIRMMTADRKVLTGWLASQTDVLSDDWEVVS